MKKATKIIQVRPAGENHQVVTLKSEGMASHLYRRKPCEQCPWDKANDGSFPAEAFRHSAPTAYDGAFNSFACHMSGAKVPATCAGFLLKGADQNIHVRLKVSSGQIDYSQISDGGCDLHGSYREMAEANGVPRDDPVLEPCRDELSDQLRRSKR